MNELKMNEIAIKANETVNDYLTRLAEHMAEYGLTWGEIKVLMDNVSGDVRDESTYRKRANKLRAQALEAVQPAAEDDEDIAQPAIPVEEQIKAQQELHELEDEDLKEKAIKAQELIYKSRMERMRTSDERIQVNAMLRRMAREESLREIAQRALDKVDAMHLVLPKAKRSPVMSVDNNNVREGLLCVSDWHYGIEINNFFNIYNPDVARQRIRMLLDEVIENIKLFNLRKLHVFNLGDMIAGRIHLQLRVNSRFDVITQTMEVSELLAQFLAELNQYVPVEYYDTLDNHSRLEPNLKESLDLESLCRITTWYLRSRMDDTGVVIHENKYGEDIIVANILGHEVGGVHGHNDKPERLVQNLMTRTRKQFDLVVGAHYHHFMADEASETAILYNGSMMGTDEYAEKLRLASIPSQNLVIVSPENVTKSVCKINLR